MLKEINKIQEEWFYRVPNELDLQTLAFSENVKEVIFQANKQDQKRECLILMAQMQSLLAKPIPKKLNPQAKPLPKLDGCRYLSIHSKKLNEITKVIFENDSPKWYARENYGCGFPSPSLQFLAENKIFIEPSIYFDFVTDHSDRKQGIQPRSVIGINIYRPWWNWAKANFTDKPKVFTKEDLANGKWNYYRFKDELYNENYNIVDALDVILAHEDEHLHETAIYAGTSYNIEIPISYLRKQYKNHPSEKTHAYIGKVLKNHHYDEELFDVYIEDAIDCLALEGNRLYNKHLSNIAPPKIDYYFDRVQKNNLWPEIAKHFNLTLSQFFEYWDISSFNIHENAKFYYGFRYYRDLPQDVIDKTYLKINNFIKKGVINNNPVENNYYHIMSYISDWTSFQVKKQLDYDYLFDENGIGKIRIDMIDEINETFIPRFNLKEAIFCLENAAINYAHTPNKYVYDKIKSQPDSDAFLFKLSKETAQDYLDHLLDSGITEQTSKRDHALLNSLRLNILINSEKDE